VERASVNSLKQQGLRESLELQLDLMCAQIDRLLGHSVGLRLCAVRQRHRASVARLTQAMPKLYARAVALESVRQA
jgi:hypothetical protein